MDLVGNLSSAWPELWHGGNIKFHQLQGILWDNFLKNRCTHRESAHLYSSEGKSLTYLEYYDV